MVLDTSDSNSSSNGGGEAQAQRGGRDRLSELPDDVLLLVLGKLGRDVRQVARTRVLSKRWRTLPLMLPRLLLSANTFLPARSPPDDLTPLPMRCLHQATSKLTDALRFFLSTPAAGAGGQQRGIRRHLTLQFTLTEHRRRLHEIGRLVGSAVCRGEAHALDLVVDTTERTPSLRAGGAVARRFTRVLRAAPPAVAGSALRSLSLRCLCFSRAADLEGALRACEALEELVLTRCRFAPAASSALTVDAPRSRLRVLELTGCRVERVHLVRAPELEELWCEAWSSEACPVTFGPASAPSLKKVTLINRAVPGQLSFKLSELLENANPLEYLHLDFATGRIWVRPENQSDLATAFSKLNKLHVNNMFAGADISWTMFFIKAAPLLEYVDIRVCPAPICDDGERISRYGNSHHQDLQWDSMSQHFERHHLQTVKIRGGIDPDRDARFVRLLVERAVNLELLVLDAQITCAKCVAAKEQDPSLVLSRFPEDEDTIDAFVSQIIDGIPTSTRIIIRSAYNHEFQY